MQNDLISLGYIVSTHGLKGQVKIRTHSGEGGSLSRNVFVQVKTVSGAMSGLKILKSQPFKNCFLTTFEGVHSIEQAELLVRGELLIHRRDLPVLGADEYYWVDLIGCRVFTTKEECLGVVDEILRTGGVDVLVIRDGSKETLLPMSAPVIRGVDRADRKITVDTTQFSNED